MFTKSFASALIALVAVAENMDEYSREGRDVSFVIALNAPALSTPQTSLNLAADPKQEPKYANRITPVGQRQQFLIGSELRRRYVEEAKTLNEEYIISQMYLQAPFVAKNILSLQAQMMGLYPSTHANDLTEWQQGNAVPPIEGADFSEWQKELGAYALPHGLQTYPIQQTGFEKDFVLSLSSKNCARYADKIKGLLAQISTNLDAEIAKNYADIASEMKEKDVKGEELCDYVTWAHYNAVPLMGDQDRQSEYGKLVSETCPSAYYNQVTQAVQKVNASEKNLVASGFLMTIKDRVDIANAKPSVDELRDSKNLPLSFTNYQALTSDILLTIASQSLEGVKADMALPASSNLIFEIWGDNTVHGYLNDAEFTPAGCSADAPCTTDLFLSTIEAKIGYSDLETACATKSDDLFIDQ